MKREHSIGVVVSETSSEISTATESVIENSRNSRPTIPPMSRIGMNTATSDRLIESTVKPTSRAPEQCRLEARHARFHVARDVLEHHDGVIDDEAGGDDERHEREVVEAVAEQVHGAEGAEERDRHRDRRHQGGAPVAQEQEHHQDDERDRR